MEIHKLDFTISDPKYPLATVVLDGQKEDQTLEAFALERSGLGDGLFPILNCICGEWGCGGYWVEVNHDGDKIIWTKIRTHNSEKDIPRFHITTPITFSKSEYKDLIDRLLKEKNTYPGFKKSYDAEKDHFEDTGEFYWAGISASD